MRVVIAGSRFDERHLPTLNWWKRQVDLAIRESGFDISEVVCGGARGVDKLGRAWANYYGVAVREFPADWNNLGKAAGYIRNKEMALYAEAVIAIWDGKSKGTGHMLDIAKDLYIPLHVRIVTCV